MAIPLIAQIESETYSLPLLNEKKANLGSGKVK